MITMFSSDALITKGGHLKNLPIVHIVPCSLHEFLIRREPQRLQIVNHEPMRVLHLNVESQLGQDLQFPRYQPVFELIENLN